MIYIFVFIIVFFPILNKYNSSTTSKNRYYWFMYLILALFMGLRYRVGGDCIRYELGFANYPDLEEYIKNPELYIKYQPLWYVFSGLCKKVFDDYFFFQFVQCILVNFAVFYYANKHCENKFAFVVMFYCFEYLYFSTEIMRESISVSFFLLAFDSLIEKKWFKYYLFVFISFLFHASSIILFILPFLYDKLSIESKNQRLLYIVILLVLVSFASIYAESFFSDTNFIGSDTLQRKTSETIEKGGLNIFGIIKKLIFSLSLFITFLILDNSCLNTKQSRFVISISILFVLVSLIYNPLSRFRNYFSIQYLCLFADMLLEFKGKNLKLLKIGLIVMCVSEIVSFGNQVQHEFYQFRRYRMYYPYTSIWEETTDSERYEVMITQFGN